MATYNLKRCKSMWKYKNCSEKKTTQPISSSSIFCYMWNTKIYSIYWLLEVMTAVISYVSMIWKGLDFYENGANIPENNVCCTYFSFVKQFKYPTRTPCEISDCHLRPSWLTPGSVEWVIFEIKLSLLLVTLWDHSWGQFHLSSHLWDCLPLLKSNSLDTNIIHLYK